VTIRDTTAPTVSITDPTTGEMINGVTSVMVSASDTVGLSYVELYVDGSYVGTDSVSPFSFSIDTNTLPDGEHQFQAKAMDKHNNAGNSQVVKPIVENTPTTNSPPSVTITSPASGSTVRGTVSVTATATDSDGISKVELYIDGQLVATVTSPSSGNTYTFSWNSATVGNGWHTIMVRAYDMLNEDGQDSDTIKVSNKGSGSGKGGPKNR
jgi:hypothetical protein